MRELHAGGCTTGGDGTQCGYITEHLAQGHFGFHDTCAGASGIHTLYLTTTLRQVANDITHVLFGGYHLYLHDRLHQGRFRLHASVLERHLCADFERQLVRVNGVERTIDNGYFEFLQRIASEHTGLHSGLEALLDRGDIFLRNVTTLHLVHELQCSLELGVTRLYANNHIGELTATTGLLLVGLAQLNGLRDSLTVCHLRTTLVALYLELAFQTVDNDFQVQLTHTRDDGLSRLLVGLHGEGGVFLSQLSQTYAQFVEVSLTLRLYGDTDHRSGELDGLQYDRMLLVAEGITGTDILEAYACAYIAGSNKVHGVLVVGVHLEDTRDTLFLARTGIVNIRTCHQLTAIHAEIAETTYIRVGSNLECQRAERLVIIRLAGERLISTRVGTIDYLGIQRARQVCTDSIKHGLYTFVLERRTADNGEDVHADSSLADCCTNLLFGDGRGVGEVFLHQHIIVLSNGLEHFVAPLFCLCLEVSGDIIYLVLSTHGLIVPQDSLHLHEVNHAFEGLFCADRNLNRARSST